MSSEIPDNPSPRKVTIPVNSESEIPSITQGIIAFNRAHTEDVIKDCPEIVAQFSTVYQIGGTDSTDLRLSVDLTKLAEWEHVGQSSIVAPFLRHTIAELNNEAQSAQSYKDLLLDFPNHPQRNADLINYRANREEFLTSLNSVNDFTTALGEKGLGTKYAMLLQHIQEVSDWSEKLPEIVS